MEASQFSNASRGRLVWVPEGTYAFVPDPVPELELDPATLRLSEDARAALGELAGLGRMIRNPYLLMRPFIRKEAISSSMIEGTFTTMEQLSLFEARPSEGISDTHEVANYVAALEYGLSRLEALPISLRLIRELHAKLLADVRGAGTRVGEFRLGQNIIGHRGQPVQEARFVPPPASEMRQALYDLEHYLHRDAKVPVLVKLALSHYQLESIHPFEDGNGRIGRLLIALQLCEQKLIPGPLLYLSGFFERHRDEYMDHLLAVSTKGLWIPWVRFFLTGILEQAHDAVERAAELVELLEHYRRELQQARGSALLLRLVDALFERPAITVSGARKVLGVTQRSAQLNVDKLVDLRILAEVTGQARNRIYVAREIIDLVNSSQPRGRRTEAVRMS